MSDRLFRLVAVILLLLVPVLFVANVLQAFRFTRLQTELAKAGEKIESILEGNKRLIAGIAGLRSPARIRMIARDQLEMKPVSSDRIIQIDISEAARVP